MLLVWRAGWCAATAKALSEPEPRGASGGQQQCSCSELLAPASGGTERPL